MIRNGMHIAEVEICRALKHFCTCRIKLKWAFRNGVFTVVNDVIFLTLAIISIFLKSYLGTGNVPGNAPLRGANS